MAILADAALDERERDLLGRFVAALQAAYGDDLDAVWLYGSRARGERPHEASDVDVLVITRSDRDDEALIPTLWRVLDEMGDPRNWRRLRSGRRRGARQATMRPSRSSSPRRSSSSLRRSASSLPLQR